MYCLLADDLPLKWLIGSTRRPESIFFFSDNDSKSVSLSFFDEVWNGFEVVYVSSYSPGSNHVKHPCLHQDLHQSLHMWVANATRLTVLVLWVLMNFLIFWHRRPRANLACWPILVQELKFVYELFCRFLKARVWPLRSDPFWWNLQRKWCHLYTGYTTSKVASICLVLQHPTWDIASLLIYRQDNESVKNWHICFNRKKKMKSVIKNHLIFIVYAFRARSCTYKWK